MSVSDIAQPAPRRKKLLLISGYFPLETGGAEHQVYCLAKYLQSRMDVHYLTTSDEGGEWQDGAIQVSALRRRKLLHRALGRFSALNYSRVRDALQRLNPDFIYVRSATAYLGMAARHVLRSQCTLVWHIAHAVHVQPFHARALRTAPFDYIDKRLAEYGIQHANYIIGQAKYEEELLQRNYGRRCDLIVGNWHPEPAQPCVKDRPVKVVWIANIKPWKRPEAFIDLAARLQDVQDVEFIMIGRPGSARYQRSLDARIRQVRGLTYLGERSVEEVNRILDESHVFVNTSEYEGFPNTFVQAWFREVPVVSLQVDPDDILAREELGFHSGSLERLAQDTRRLVGDPELRTRMGQRAKAYATRNHSLTENLGRIAAFFESIA